MITAHIMHKDNYETTRLTLCGLVAPGKGYEYHPTHDPEYRDYKNYTQEPAFAWWFWTTKHNCEQEVSAFEKITAVNIKNGILCKYCAILLVVNKYHAT